MKMNYVRLVLIAVMPLMTVACGRLAKKVDEGIESAGTEVTGVPVDVKHVKLSISRGAGQISGLTVANPQGYDADYALQMNLLRLNLGIISTLTGKAVVLDELVIDSPTLIFEANAQDGSNWKDIVDKVIANTESEEKPEHEPTADSPAPDAPGKPPIRIAVRKLLIKDVGFNASFVDGTTMSGVLPTIHLVDIGGKDGATPVAFGTAIVVAMARGMFKQLVADQLEKNGSKIVVALDALDVEEILAVLEETSELTDDQAGQVRPIIEQQIDSMKIAVRQAQEQGFVDFGSLPGRFEAATDDLLHQLVDILNERQLEALSRLFDERNVEVVQEIWNGLVTELTQFLDLNADQMVQLQPILREQLTKRTALLQGLVDSPEGSIEEFVRNYEAIQAETRDLLDEVLSPSQMEALAERQAEFLEILRTVYFGVM